MKQLELKFTGLFLFVILFSCSSPTNSNPKVSGHDVKKDGVYHKAGLKDPNTNCVEYHGEDLKGGSSGISCYSCHGKMW